VRPLRIAAGLSLPESLVTSTIVAYGGKGMGKTNLAAVLVEELSAAGLRWAWLDPLGVSWGLRHSIDGTGRGVECLILGGTRGDIPIFPEGGAAVADVVIEESTNVLVDFSRRPTGEMWSIGEKIRFVTAYALRLFQRQGEQIGNRRRVPLFQVLDEAARYIPQISRAGDVDIAKCLGAWEQLVEEGRNIGLGVGLFTQRSPTGAALRELILREASAMERGLLSALIEAYPGSMPKAAILEKAGYAASGKISKAFAKLVTVNYAVKAGRGELRASEELFA